MSKKTEPTDSRRARRLAQGSSEQSSAAGGYPTVPLLPAPDKSTRESPARESPARESPTVRRPRRATDAPVDALVTPPKGERPSRSRARDRAALRADTEAAAKPAVRNPLLATRGALRPVQLETERVPVSAHDVEGSMSVAEAFAARQALVKEAREQIDHLPAAVTADPLAVDPDIMAQQRAIAERAEVLNRRAQVRERLVQESARSRPPANDPTAADNLAMVTPLEFIRVPGIDRPVMRPPATSHIPVVSRLMPVKRTGPTSSPADSSDNAPAQSPGPAQSPAPAQSPGPAPTSGPWLPENTPPLPGRAAARAAARSASRGASLLGIRGAARSEGRGSRPEARGTGKGTDPPTSAVVSGPQPTARTFERAERPPLPAESAHGLEPLDAVTAGLGRLQRNRLILWGAVVIGAAALIAGFTMLITGLAR